MDADTLTVRWESATRYYTAVLHKDLLDDWVLTIARGGRKNRLGALEHKLMGSRERGLTELETLDKRRKRRGYVRAI